MQDTLIISGHPNPKKSYANNTILRFLEGGNGIYVNHLIESYPNYQVDAENEINALIGARHVILEFPFHWYGVPPHIKDVD